MNSSKSIQENIKLIAGEDYPQTYREFVTMFPDNKSCREFLYKLRWGNEFICPKCNKSSKEPWHQTHKRLVCPNCRHQTTVTAETIFDKTRTPLTTWLEAAWHITTAKNGMSAKTIEQTLGISYQTAWTMLQRFRVAMVHTERKKLLGTIEIDETLVVWAGEFGRTPFAQGANGRDHNQYGFTVWMAGGGVRPGMTYGATDNLGFQSPKESFKSAVAGEIDPVLIFNPDHIRDGFQECPQVGFTTLQGVCFSGNHTPELQIPEQGPKDENHKSKQTGDNG